ncbi:methyl-accepting chemotaxis sensory transducer [Caballeronia sordidicola]|uniref:Methyl-accepting chemotaxis sensory transducer n=1 Tax=Caballeronia sordidicola TaxID=196367 RepID=A0A158GPD2_CABSO|nr:methyl-accepting chemotaxis protein [Caballeronia sordidicola]SAL33773.1 methyl-accepting chemotaxis sensory transducer [Caballeronia sordidicola]
MIEQYLLAALAGCAVTAAGAWSLHKLYIVKQAARLQSGDAARVKSQMEELARLSASADQRDEECRVLEAELAQLRDDLARQSAISEEHRAALAAAIDDKDQWLDHAKRIADEASRLKALASTFERWHEQMISLMAQNQDMHAKNHELSSIVKHVVIVSLNASIEAARAGAAGRGFAVVAGEVRTLAARSEELSRSYRDSLHRNDLTTTATFQDIQAGGKMITASLSSVEVLADQFQSRLH